MNDWVRGGCALLAAVFLVSPGCQRTAVKPEGATTVAVKPAKKRFWKRWKEARAERRARRADRSVAVTQRWRRSRVVRSAYKGRPMAEVIYHDGLVVSAPKVPQYVPKQPTLRQQLPDVPRAPVQVTGAKPVAEVIAEAPKLAAAKPVPLPRRAVPTRLKRYEAVPVKNRWEPVPPPPGMKPGTRTDMEPELDMPVTSAAPGGKRPMAELLLSRADRKLPKIDADVIDTLWVRSQGVRKVSYSPSKGGVLLVP